MPLHNLFKYAFRTCLNDISMTRNQSVKVPAVDPFNRLVEGWSVFRTVPMVDQATLPFSIALRIVYTVKQLREKTRGRINFRPLILFVCWQVEHQIRFDYCAGWLMEKYELLVRMNINIFIIKFGIELAQLLEQFPWHSGLRSYPRGK
jgi:hypothetical protein